MNERWSERRWAAETNRAIAVAQRSHKTADLKVVVDLINRHTIGAHAALREQTNKLDAALKQVAGYKAALDEANRRLRALDAELETTRRQLRDAREDAIYLRSKLGTRKQITRDANGMIETVEESVE